MKKNVILTIAPVILVSIMFISWDPDPNFTLKQFEQHSPIAKEFWVQQLEQTHPDGNMIVGVHFEHDTKLPEQLKTYLGKEVYTTFRDDGVFPDNTALDGEYTAIVRQDPIDFEKEYNTNYNKIFTRGYSLQFTGHLGEVIDAAKISPFNSAAFNNFEQVLLEPLVFNEPSCDASEIEKPKSLLITDLRVVEDPIRTYNIVEESGNPVGAWTFGI